MNRSSFQFAASWAGVLLVVLIASGCSPPKVFQQRLVSQPNMTFTQSSIWNYAPRQASQVETGLAFAGGGQSAGCTSCK